MSTLLITISRDGADLVLSGSDDANEIGVTNFAEPAQVARIEYAPGSRLFAGDQALSATLAHTLLTFTLVTDKASTETESQSLLDDVRAAVGQFSYTVTVEINDAPAKTWQCDTGSVAPLGARTLLDLEHHNPEWSVSIPCNPVPTVGA